MSTEISHLDFFKTFEANRQTYLEEFLHFLRFKSISAETEYVSEVRGCANWLLHFLADSGLEVELWETSGQPTVFAEYKGAGPEAPTVMIYNHYDVQPVDPLALWESPPFEPRIQGEEVYARGAVDNKGQCMYVILAVRELLKRKSLKVNLKLIIEGEEETGSAGLAGILEAKKDRLQADYLYIVDLGMESPTQPAITLGVRGICTMTLELQGSNTDLHSGMVGGIVYNPARALVEILASCYEPDGRVAIPGFYDDVLLPSPEDLQAISFDFQDDNFRKLFGAEPSGGEASRFPSMQRAGIRPTLEINGISGGYSGEGFKTVIPAKTMAKISCRLVPNQQPEKIATLVENFLLSKVPPGIKASLHQHPGHGAALRTELQSKAVKASAQALSAIYDKPCKFILSGGSIPIAVSLAETSGAEVVMLGLGLPSDNVHAPNEHFGLNRLQAGFACIALSLSLL